MTLRRRISRRRLLAGSASATAAAVAIACGDKRRPPSRPAQPETSLSPTPGNSTAGARGGILRAYTLSALPPDSLDPHLTQMASITDLHSGVFSKLLRYADERAGTVVPDLAVAMPEQPDELTYIFKLRGGVRFHDSEALRNAHPLVAGRPLTATDVKYSFDRQLNRNSPLTTRFYRRGNWEEIDRIDALDALTVRITLKRPVAPFTNFIAGRHAFILARETTEGGVGASNATDMLGTGPFLLDSFVPQTHLKLRRNPDWFARNDDSDGAGPARPFIDGYDAFYSPQLDPYLQGAFATQIVDQTSFEDPTTLGRALKTSLAGVELEVSDAGATLCSRLLLDRAPFKDDRVRRAIHLAIDRRALSELLYPQLDGEASARLSGPVAPAMRSWAIDDEDLLARQGYRSDDEGRDADRREARQLWDAAAGDGTTGALEVLFASVPKSLAAAGVEFLRRQVQEVLGATIAPYIDPSGYAYIAASYTRNFESASDGTVQFTFALEDGGVDLDDWLYPYFRSGQALNSFRIEDPTLDAMLDKSRTEFENEARHKIGLDIQDYLLANVNARIEYLAPVLRRITWGYVRNSALEIWHGSNYKLADIWLDKSHAAWPTRPA